METELAFLNSTLLPRSLLLSSSSSDAATAQDLEFVQIRFLKALGGSAEVLEQAKAVLAAAAADPMEARFDDGDRCGRGLPEGRRQALGRKRARFSMKPDGSKEPPNVNLRANLETITDPEEYFSALDKIEVAEKELKKLTGQAPLGVTENCQNRMPRQRRPGLLGKSARYKHVLSTPFDTKVEQVPSQKNNEIISKDPPDTMYHDSSQERYMIDAGLPAVQNEADKENKVNNILDTLLSSFETLSETEATALLQERLKLKQISVDRIQLPVTPNTIRTRDEPAAADGRSIGQRITRALINSNRSPLATISLLKKQMLHIDPLTDHYTSPPDESPSALADSMGQNESPSHPSFPIESKGTVKSASNERDSSFTPRTKGNTTSFIEHLESLLSHSDKKTPNGKYCEDDVVDTSPSVDRNGGVSVSNRIDRGSHDISTGNQYFSEKQGDGVPFEASTHKKTGPCFNDLESEINMEDKTQDTADSLVANDGGCEIGPVTVNTSSQPDIHAGEKVNEMLLEERQSLNSSDIKALADSLGQNESLSHPSFPIESKGTVKSASNERDSSFTPRTKGNTTSFIEHLESLLSHSDKKTPNGKFCEDVVETSPSVDRNGGVSVSNRIDRGSHDISTGNQYFSEKQGDGVPFEASTHKKTGSCFNDLESEINMEDKTQDTADSLVANDGGCEIGPVTVNTSSQPDIHAGEKVNEMLLEERQFLNSSDIRDQIRPSVDEIIAPNSLTDDLTMSLESDNESLGLHHASEVFINRKSRKEAVSRKAKSKMLRKSLAEAGTRWESGIRRSTRIRSRPLEYWRGERFLYGRIHDSLATVIGVKYSSPGGNQQLKVKSYVSEKYAELVEMASLH